MEFNGSVYISPNHLKSDYKALKLSISSEEIVWKTAVKIFDDRIAGRYLHQIQLLSHDLLGMADQSCFTTGFFQFPGSFQSQDAGTDYRSARYIR